jgi:8-oxo-dGTP diphosphatase
MYKKIQKVSAKAIIERDGKVLLVKDPKGIWELPGGRIEHGEEPRQSLIRELNEELGWSKITIKKIVDIWSFTSKVENRHNHFIILVYSCTSDEKKINQNDEYTEYKWVPIQEIKKLNMRDGYKKSVKKYLIEN